MTDVDPKAKYRLAALPGDGIGPEVTRAALRVLEATGERFGFEVAVEEHPVGWAAVKERGVPLPPDTLEAARGADAVLLGAVGHPDAEGATPEQRPEAGLLALRRALACWANLRPMRITKALASASPLREEGVRGVDLMIVRELGGGLYYGEPRGRTRESAHNTLRYSEHEVERIAEVAFRQAEARRGRLVSVDKANVLETSRLWRDVVSEVARRYPAVRLEHMLVDRAAMELVLRPKEFDVILTSNLFGDILSDEAAGVAGSLGLLPSASLGDGTPLFEPVHGSAPDIAGRGIANPIGAILSVAMLLELAFGRPEAAHAVERAVEACCAGGLLPPDLAAPGTPPTDTETFAWAVAEGVADAAAGGTVEPTGARPAEVIERGTTDHDETEAGP